jgi:C-terminal processing protease CtpA/Prc
MLKSYRIFAALLSIFLISIVVTAIGEDIPPAAIENDEGGPVVVRGELNYTNPFFGITAENPVILLEDQTGFVNRDWDYVFPVESQIFAQITSSVFSSPFDYVLQLPQEPQGPLNDVDNDNEDDVGVQIFQVAYWTNTYGDIFLEARDGHGWSGNYSSMMTNDDPDLLGEYTNGWLLIYAPVEGQAFPSGFGDDAQLFTDDDPLVIVPQGWTVVQLDVEGGAFTFDRSREINIPLREAEGAEAVDFSDMSYPEAFDAMIELFRNEYAFTEYKGLDWDALQEAYRPRFEEAEDEGDVVLYALAMRDFLWEIPDSHIGSGALSFLIERFFEETDGGLGIAIRETTDGRVIVNFLLPDSPADEAGIELGAEITEINGVPILEATDNAVAWSAPFSMAHVRRLQQLRYVTRFFVGDEVEVTFRNPSDIREETVTMETINERVSFGYSSFFAGTSGIELPVEWEYVGDYFLVSISSFSDSPALTVQLWERMINEANQNEVQGIIIDMRNNGGGLGSLADNMAGYFFDEEQILGYGAGYSETLGEFYTDERFPDRMSVPEENLRYSGEVVVLVGPNCASACEFFSYDMTVNDRATIIGQYPTVGAGGGVNDFMMPEDLSVRFPVHRPLDVEGNIIIEGIGVVPEVLVPVNEDTLGLTGVEYINNDPVLDAAVNFLAGATAQEIIDAGEIGYDEEDTGFIEAGQRIRYTFTIEADADPVGIYIVADMDTYLRVYDETGESILVENDDFAGTVNSGFPGVALDRDLALIIEVATFDDAESGEYTLIVTTGSHPFDITINDEGDIAVGDIVEGEIEVGERNSYTLELEADEAVNISVAGSDDLDTYLRVYDAEGDLIAENDDVNEDEHGSTLEDFSVDEDSTVTIIVGTFEDNSAGEYELEVEAAD